MKRVISQLAIMMAIATSVFAVDFQGEIIKIEGNQIVIEIFGNETVSFKVGGHVSLKGIPQGVPTLDMLKG